MGEVKAAFEKTGLGEEQTVNDFKFKLGTTDVSVLTTVVNGCARKKYAVKSIATAFSPVGNSHSYNPGFSPLGPLRRSVTKVTSEFRQGNG